MDALETAFLKLFMGSPSGMDNYLFGARRFMEEWNMGEGYIEKELQRMREEEETKLKEALDD